MLGLYLVLLVLGLAELAISITFIHFVISVSQPHAIVILSLYLIKMLGSFQLRIMLSKREK